MARKVSKKGLRGTKPKCCVVDARGEPVGCYTSEEQAASLRAILKKTSGLRVACGAGLGKLRRRRRK